ncbi:MAG: 50S ribosomal protein L21 [Deltaproteobacteria bacterium]|jgi:large subunit ribosomal protein L21|nr:50S ribosomal protein L21 [Deltaproteobacteria bacterium]
MYAILKIGGRQYQVTEGQRIQVNRLDVNVDDELYLKDVLLVSGDDGVTLDSSELEAATVRALAKKNILGPKIRVFKTKRRTGFQKTIGHRQKLTELLITDILPTGREGHDEEKSTSEAPEPVAQAPAPGDYQAHQEPETHESSPESPEASNSEETDKEGEV